MEDIKLLKMAFERVHDELETIKAQYQELKSEMKDLKDQISQRSDNKLIPDTKEDQLIDTKEVLNMLGICYNTLQKIIQNGFIKPIRINQRRIRYSKLAVLNFISISE